MEIREMREKRDFMSTKRLFLNKCDDSRMIKNMNRQGANISERIKIKYRTGRLYCTKNVQRVLLLFVLCYWELLLKKTGIRPVGYCRRSVDSWFGRWHS